MVRIETAIGLTVFCAVGICSMVYHQNPLLVQETFTKTARRGRRIKNDFVEKLHYVKGSKMIEVSSLWNQRRIKKALSEALATLGMQSGDSVTSTLGIQQGNMEDTHNMDMEPGLTEINEEYLPVEHGETFALGQDTNVLNLGVRSITDALLNVPVPNSDLLHAPEIQAHYKGMGQQRGPTACFGSDQMEQRLSLNGNNGSSGAIQEMPEQPSTGQGMTINISNDHNISQVEEQSLSNRQYCKKAAVTTLRTQPLHMINNYLLTPKLVFANQVPQTIYTGINITDNYNKPIELQLIDINTGKRCTNVEGWNKKVKIEVINGDLEFEDLDSDKFNNNIVKQREGKGPLLVGNTEVTFNQQGVGTIGDIRFTDNSKWIRSGKFRLGACIDSKRCGTTINIHEGLSEKFVVKEHRGLLNEKHYPPMPNDDVWRLKMIAKDGPYHQRLKDKNINSVQDFLKILNENPSFLKEILIMKTNAWNKVVEHAQTCRMDLDNANFENNADFPKSQGLESSNQPNHVLKFQPENMEPGIFEMNGELSTGHAKTFASGQDTNVLNSEVITGPLLNVPAPNACMLHALESQAQCSYTSIGMDMGQQNDPAAHFGSDHSNSISSLNGNNGSLEQAPEAGQAYQDDLALDTQLMEAPEDPTMFTLEELGGAGEDGIAWTTWMKELSS